MWILSGKTGGVSGVDFFLMRWGVWGKLTGYIGGGGAGGEGEEGGSGGDVGPLGGVHRTIARLEISP